MSTMFRRTLATASDAAAAAAASSSSSSSSAASRRSSTTLPRAVRSRREKFPTSPVIQRTLTPAQERRFQDAFDEREFKDGDRVVVDEDVAREMFLKRHDEWRSRIRGHTQVLKEPAVKPVKGKKLSSQTELALFKDASTTPSTDSLAAQRVYLPNIQIRLMRNHTPIGEPYDPYVATFRIPQSMTKLDLRSYLSAVYGLNVTFIRTDNYVADVQRLGTAGQLRRKAGSTKTYKRAVVGLHEPFQYPDDMEELDAVISAVDHPPTEGYENQSHEDRVLAAELAKQGKEKRQDWLETNFMMDLQTSGRKRSMMKMANGWRWRAGTSDNKGNVVREIMKRRMDREKAIVDALEKLQLNNEATAAVTAQPSVAA